jgi:hypothetical protein
MKALYPGHRYELDHLDGSAKTTLQFVQRKPLHAPIEGVTNQEVLRAVIDRVKVLNAEVPWSGNEQIIYHLRMVIALHEMRALLRHIEKHDCPIENASLGPDGHLDIRMTALSPRSASDD